LLTNPNHWPDFAPNGLIHDTIDLSSRQLLEHCPEHIPFQLLTSGDHGTTYLLLGSRWTLEGHKECWHFSEGQTKQTFHRKKGDFSSSLDLIHKQWISRQPEPFKAGLYLSYESGWDPEEPRKELTQNETCPELILFCPKEIIVSNPKETISYRNKGDVSLLLADPSNLRSDFATDIQLKNDETKDSYIKKAEEIIQQIRKGNSFQVNLSQSFSSKNHPEFRSWANHALTTQPAAFAGVLRWNNFDLLSLSPERLLKLDQSNKLITRPIAGTLPRNLAKEKTLSSSQKKDNLKRFKENAKELAEHNMLIDLERNDLGKVSETGSVQVEEYLTIETLPHVHHLVSEVIGKKRSDLGPGTAIFATFPGGTITGCPKLETMHILNELESEARMAYTGSMGYLGPNEFDTNILIRSAMVNQNGIKMRFGGGIVWDSDPEKEYLETLAKAHGLIRSLLEGGAQFDSDHRSLRQFFS
jgi:anthranilate/para-aminobenzoate synthase component I